MSRTYWVQLGQVALGYVSDAHAQSIMRKGVAGGVPPRDFKVLSGWYYRINGVRNCDFGEITCGITSVQKFINIRTTIM
jgi:hypothetical protein